MWCRSPRAAGEVLDDGRQGESYTQTFARGVRRLADWLDWIVPEAWRREHDVLHHHHTGEIEDPDLVEVSARAVRDAAAPRPLKYLALALLACTWKLTYYAPSTLRALRRPHDAAPGPPPRGHHVRLFNPLTAEGRDLWRRCVLPYATFRFAAVPALFLAFGPAAAANVLVNSLAAELLTNLHTFLIVVPSHAGADLYRFEGRTRGRAERYLRQIAGTSNYPAGGDVHDFLHGFLNYQIEHHLFPDLPPLKLREIQPRVRALCAKHGLPYVQESVFRRAAKLVDILVGRASMRTMDTRIARRGESKDTARTS
jgi:fatty acid desaturase